MELTAEKLRSNKQSLFATYESIKEVQEYAKTEPFALICIGIYHNTLLELLAKSVEEEV